MEPLARVWLFRVSDAERSRFDALPQEDRDAALRYRFEHDRLRQLAARLFLRDILSECLGHPPADIRFGVGEHGKPFVEGRPLEFNLSHSGEVIAIAVAPDPVGIDVEPWDRKVAGSEIAGRWFDPDEQAWIESHDSTRRQEAFFRLWTIKEAAIKADGRGMAIPLSRVNVDLKTIEDDVTLCRADHCDWWVSEIPLSPPWRVAVARRQSAPVRLIDSRR